jgi:hypothetical protein
VLAVRTFLKRKADQAAAHEARLRAMAQTYLAAAGKKKAAEVAASNASTSASGKSRAMQAPDPAISVRGQRECPFCAEQILKRAKVCKHCRRGVEPLAS